MIYPTVSTHAVEQWVRRKGLSDDVRKAILDAFYDGVVLDVELNNADEIRYDEKTGMVTVLVDLTIVTVYRGDLSVPAIQDAIEEVT